MKQNQARTTTAATKKAAPASMGSLFEKDNIRWMIIGAVVMAIGFILMAGGGSENPNEFLPQEVYGFRRITLAPIIILAGLAIEVYAIFRKPKNS